MYVYYVYIAHVHICAYVCGLSQGQLVTFRKDGNRIAAGEPLNLLVVESEIFWGAASRERQRFHELSQQIDSIDVTHWRGFQFSPLW